MLDSMLPPVPRDGEGGVTPHLDDYQRRTWTGWSLPYGAVDAFSMMDAKGNLIERPERRQPPVRRLPQGRDLRDVSRLIDSMIRNTPQGMGGRREGEGVVEACCRLARVPRDESGYPGLGNMTHKQALRRAA